MRAAISAGCCGGKYVLSVLYLVRALTMAAFVAAPLSPASVYVFAAVMGFTWLGTVPLTNGVISQMFGVRYIATLFGFVFFGHQLGSFFGVWLGAVVYDATHLYLLPGSARSRSACSRRCCICRSTTRASRARHRATRHGHDPRGAGRRHARVRRVVRRGLFQFGVAYALLEHVAPAIDAAKSGTWSAALRQRRQRIERTGTRGRMPTSGAG